MKRLLKSGFQSVGLDVRRIRPDRNLSEPPPEATAKDKELFSYIWSRELTMVSSERLWSTILACRFICERNIPGDFVECGVWRGGNAIAAAAISAEYQQDRKVYLFDTFEGMTAPGPKDINIPSGQSAELEFQRTADAGGWCVATIGDVSKNFSDAGLLHSGIVFVEGDVIETLSSSDNLPSEIALLRLDTDWYESTALELKVLFPLVSRGGIVIIDDYAHWDGSRRATDEYLDSNKISSFMMAVDDSRVFQKFD